MGIPVPAGRTGINATADGWIRDPGGSTEGTTKGARSRRSRPRRRDHTRRARRGVPAAASGRAGDDREATLAARQSNKHARREANRGHVTEGRVRVAPDDPGRASLRSNASAPTGSQPCGRLGANRLQPSQARGAEPAAAPEGEAAVRVLGAARGDRCPARTRVRPDGDLRRRDRTSTVRTLRTRATRRRP